MWINTEEGYVNSRHVITIGNPDDRNAALQLVDGRSIFSHDRGSVILAGSCPIIQANPGFEVLYLGEYDGKPTYRNEPIIAWRVSEFDSNPITISGPVHTLDFSIRCPLGQVLYNRVEYEGIEAWLASDEVKDRIVELRKPTAEGEF